MTTANKVTILRIVLVPFFVVALLYYAQNGSEFYRWLALSLFAVASACDGIDGYIARRFNQRSELGALLDPLADKLLLLSAVVLLSLGSAPHLERLPLWLAGTIIGRDVLLLVGLVVIFVTVGRPAIRPRAIGKIATVLQMGVVLWVLLKLPGLLLPWMAVSAAIATAGSGILYILDGVRQLSTHPASLPSASKP
jgi:CDP-diacylglycerol--glycerol-3-phosphate 3-phosphatidyltransferase